MSLFVPELGISPLGFHATLKEAGVSECGGCDQCTQGPRSVPQLPEVSAARGLPLRHQSKL